MVDLIKRYVENRIQLVKLELIGVLANVAAGLISSFLLFIMGMLILLMFSLSLAFWLAQVFESEVIGFAIVGGIYTLVFFIYLRFSKKIVDKKVKDVIVKEALADEGVISEFNESTEL